MKKILLSVIAAVLSGIAWHSFSVAVAGADVFQAKYWNILIFLLALAFSYAFLFIIALTKDKFDFFLTTIVCSLWILVFLGTGTAALVSAGAMFVALQAIREFPHALHKTINLRYYSAAYTKIALVVLVMLGMTAGYVNQQLNRTISDQGFSTKTSSYLWPYIKSYVNQFNSEQTVDQFLFEQFKKQGISNPQSYMLVQEKQRLSAQFGFDITGREKMSDLGKSFLAAQLNEMVQRFSIERTGIYIIFLSLLALWPFGRLIFALAALAVYRGLRRAGFVRVVETQVAAKNLEIA